MNTAGNIKFYSAIMDYTNYLTRESFAATKNPIHLREFSNRVTIYIMALANLRSEASDSYETISYVRRRALEARPAHFGSSTI